MPESEQAVPPAGRIDRGIRLLQELEESQWWPTEKMRVMQACYAQNLVNHALKTVPFYKGRLPVSKGSDVISLDEWQEIPTMKRSDLVEAGQALVSVAVPPAHGQVVVKSASGSTGRPLRIARTARAEFFWAMSTLRRQAWHGWDPSLSYAVIRSDKGAKPSNPEGRHISAKFRATWKINPTGPSIFLDVNFPIDHQLAWLRKHNPAYPQTWPTNAYHLAAHCLAEGIKIPNLSQIHTLGEIVSPEIREISRRAFGAKIFDIYAAEEVGDMALQCPEHDHYHAYAEEVLLEVVDQAGRPSLPGSVGKVLATPLHNFASPLIRYEVGDYAEVGEPCPCGRGLPVLHRIIGRERNMFRLQSGKSFFPVIPNVVQYLVDTIDVRKYQLAQITMETLEFRMVSPRRLTAEEEKSAQDMIIQNLGQTFRVTFSYLDEIPRSPGGKYLDLICELPSDESVSVQGQ